MQGRSLVPVPRKRRGSNNSGTSIPISRFRYFVLKSILDGGFDALLWTALASDGGGMLYEAKESKRPSNVLPGYASLQNDLMVPR